MVEEPVIVTPESRGSHRPGGIARRKPERKARQSTHLIAVAVDFWPHQKYDDSAPGMLLDS
jgi:hypothetical protein